MWVCVSAPMCVMGDDRKEGNDEFVWAGGEESM